MNWQEALASKSHCRIVVNDEGEAALRGPTDYVDDYRLVLCQDCLTIDHIPSAEGVQWVLEEFTVPQEGWR